MIFEGEYKNGKRNGEGKEFYENGELKFEGEFFNGSKKVEYDCMEMGGIPTQSVNICFVHELQHFLNQCGIERKIKV